MFTATSTAVALANVTSDHTGLYRIQDASLSHLCSKSLQFTWLALCNSQEESKKQTQQNM